MSLSLALFLLVVFFLADFFAIPVIAVMVCITGMFTNIGEEKILMRNPQVVCMLLLLLLGPAIRSSDNRGE
jgi:hypothetical protein